ncbi:MAG: hypothetical protein K2W95_28590 [Candidatus Obscuribacterales bacterium]|nr:hypothetical protein [Candidatus Obscuribacterales bacterium]
MGIFDDIADGFEKVADTVADTITSPLDTLSDLADHGLGVIGDMRGAAALVPIGFPALALMGELDEVTNNPLMEAMVDTVGNAPKFPGEIPNIGQMLGDVTEAPTGLSGFGALGRILGGRSDAEQVALNPQPLPPLPELLAPAEIGRILRGMNRRGERALNPQPLPPSPVELRNMFDILNGTVDEHALNPQPLPPSPVELRSKFGQKLGGGERALNPQPLPPSPKDLFEARNRGAEQVSLNPQPLPPAPEELSRVIDSAKRGPEVFLNPQPLPPAPEELFVARRIDAKALNPQPLPPLPLNQLLDVNQMKLQQLSKASLAKARMI